MVTHARRRRAADSVGARRDLRDAPFLVAARGGRPAHVPVWFMRQAGRSLPEYRALRADTGMLAACLTPELACEITLQPVRRHGVDAAILFSDIVVPLHAAGIGVDIVPGTGPVVAAPGAHRGRRRAAAGAGRRAGRSGRRRRSACCVRELGSTPLIGFAGAPFTLASYLVEGGPSRNHERTKALMHAAPDVWHALMDAARRHHRDLPAGAGRRRRGRRAAVRLVGRRAVRARLPRVRRCRTPRGCSPGWPRPACRGSTSASARASCWGRWREAGADVVGVDWRVPLDAAARRAGGTRPVQGNLDPAVLFADAASVEAEARRIVAEGRRRARARVQPGPRRAARTPTRTC